MKQTLLVALGLVAATTMSMAQAQVSPQTLHTLSTPNRVETRIGPLDFKDGAPSAETVRKVRDALDFNRGLDAFLNSYGGASAYALCQGFASIGANDNSVVIFPQLMDS